MYKVFLADDEAAMRTGVRNNIDWDSSDFVLAGEAPDGELALAQMQEIMPDILITDVRMPFMDGIELSRNVRKTMPWMKIIILSGHDEFEYAKQAISIGIEEYLLKPVTSEKLMETLKDVAVRIEEEKERLRNIEDLISDAKQIRAERLLSDLLYENIEVDKALPLADELGLSLASDLYLIMSIEPEAPEEDDRNINTALACIKGVLDDWGNNHYFSRGIDKIICVLKGDEEEALAEDAYACAQAIKHEVKRNASYKVGISIGSIVSDIKDWPESKKALDIAGKHSRDSITGSKYSDIIMQAQEYIQANYSRQDISLHTVAKEVNISPNHFSTIFRQETGETFINYLTRIRIERAKALLKATQIRTSDIGYEIGYNDTHYFSYVFKKNTGITPKEFRNSSTAT